VTTTPCVCTTVRKAGRALTRLYDAAIGRAELTTAQFAVLRELERSGPVTMSRVAEALIMDRTSLYRAVAPLLKKGLLKSVASEEDVRAKCLTFTPAGRARMARAAKEWELVQESVVAHVGPRRWQELSAVLLELAEQTTTLTLKEAT